MTKDELEAIVRSAFPEAMYTQPGAVLSCGMSTIRRFPFYLMGLNPGGRPDVITHRLNIG
jgi:hypothetical protein